MPRTIVSLASILLAFSAAGQAVASEPVDDKAAIDRVLDQQYPHLDALYKDLHAHPELGFQETRTAASLAREMRGLGFAVTEHVGRTGLVAIYKNGAGPTVMVRTELDALPMEEKTGLAYASHDQGEINGRRTFVAHSCGHDIHMTAWVGAAEALVALKGRWRGALIIAQPAEEEISGADAMLADHLFTRFPKPDYGFALHSGPAVYGQVAYRAGVLTSNADDIEITFKGRGGHGASPEKTIDPVLIASRFVVDVQSVVSREKAPLDRGVVTIGSIMGGTVGNIIPDQVVVRGTIRDYDAATRETLRAGVARTARAEAAMAGAPEPEIKIGVQNADAVVNDPSLTQRTAVVFKAAFGSSAIEDPRPITASEDYSAFVKAGVPSLYFMIGVYSPQRIAEANAGGAPLPYNHSPYYAPVPEPTVRAGVEAMTLAVMTVTAPNRTQAGIAPPSSHPDDRD